MTSSSEFKVEIPVWEQRAPAKGINGTRSGARKPGVLVVDDDASVRTLLSIVLRDRGFTVFVAADGLSALSLYRQHRTEIALVLLDVRMPELDGPQTLAGLKEVNPEVRCCFMSGDLGPHTVGELSDLGALHVIAKPFHLMEAARLLWKLANDLEPQKASTQS